MNGRDDQNGDGGGGSQQNVVEASFWTPTNIGLVVGNVLLLYS